MKRIVSLLTLSVIAVFFCVTLSSCSTPIFGFTVTDEGVVVTDLKNDRFYAGATVNFGSDVLGDLAGGLVALNDDLFADVDSITKVLIPEGVTRIGARAFAGCDNLEEVILPSTLEYIGEDAFADCPKLKTNTEAVGEHEFKLCYLGTPDNDYFALVGYDNSVISADDDGATYSFNVNEQTVIIASGALKGKSVCATELYIPDSVRYIGEHAFRNASLKKAVVSKNLQTIGVGAFEGCDSLGELTIPFVGSEAHDSFAEIVTEPEATHFGYIFGASRFDFNKTKVPEALTSVTVTGTSPIASYAFKDCTSLRDITVAAEVRSIGFGAFKGCDSVEFMSLPFVGASAAGKENAHLGYVFGALDYTWNTDCVPETLTEIHITGSAYIGEHAFEDLTSIKRMYLYEKVNGVSATAFENCSFGYNGLNGAFYLGSPDCEYLVLVELRDKSAREFIVESTVKVIADGAFADCDSLTRINYCSNRTDWNKIYIGNGNDVLDKARITYNYVKK